ncbi:MAG: radical SAM family heme chaperone HemW, partial [Firmicutes bacterium]|nr:radical SAM family heme chaperone HemW [Bacillota bacterium]
MRIDALYVHIPFCLRKCNYCDFASFPLEGHGPLFAAYPDLLARELELWGDAVDLSRLRTVYFGGGTPSLLESETIRRLLALLPPAARIEECTLEANPETVDQARLTAFRQAGANRLSLGVQSFDQGLLRAMGRGHDGERAAAAVSWARQAGFDNISLDLIYGLPGQTLAQWRDSLERALALAPEHISLYGLTIHPDTPWGRQLAQGSLAAPDEDLAADMLELAMELLPENGFRQYEIAN